MNVSPNLLDHPKFTRFKAELGAPEAIEYLLRLWGHCQRDTRGEEWGKVTAEYIETICGWRGEPGKLFNALVKPFCGKPGWIEVRSRGVRITGWNDENKRLVTNWNLNRSGVTKKPNPHGPPKGTPRGAQGDPEGNPIGLDLTGVDGRGGEPPPPPAPPEPGIPTREQIRAYGRAQEIPAERCDRFWTHHTVTKSWLYRGKVIDWQTKLRSWQEADEKTAVEKIGGGDRAQLEALLDSTEDPEKRRALSAQLREMGAAA